jgi:hypothetical protein
MVCLQTCLIEGTRPFLIDNLLHQRCTTISPFDFAIDLGTSSQQRQEGKKLSTATMLETNSVMTIE